MAKVMIVEDDNSLREIYSDALKAEDFDVVSAADGEEALATAVKEKPDLIILDVMMPKISGFDVLDILRSTPETKHAKIMMMTALSQQSDKERGKRLGANRYLVKSQVTVPDIVKNVNELLAEDGNNDNAPTANPSNNGAAAPIDIPDLPVGDATDEPVPAIPPTESSQPQPVTDAVATDTKSTTEPAAPTQVTDDSALDEARKEVEKLAESTTQESQEVKEQVENFADQSSETPAEVAPTADESPDKISVQSTPAEATATETETSAEPAPMSTPPTEESTELPTAKTDTPEVEETPSAAPVGDLNTAPGETVQPASTEDKPASSGNDKDKNFHDISL